MLDKILFFLNRYKPVTLDEIENVKLMNRIDIKYVVPIKLATRLIEELYEDYFVLEIASQKSGQYQTVYYDTADLQMFYMHVTGRFPRFKVRERMYSQNGTRFWELKHKTLNGRTLKKRFRINDDDNLHEESNKILVNNTPFYKEELYPSLGNHFNRVTLINNTRTERVTLDFNLVFYTSEGLESPVFENTVVMEL